LTTVIDVARIAGVSSATVSRVLSGQGPVSADMRQRVLAVVQRLDFRPNHMAQGLRRGYSSTVALLVGDIEQNHFAATTKHIQSALTGRGLDLLLYNLGHSDKRLCGILDRAIGMHLRGVIVASSDKVPLRDALPLFRNLERRGVAVISLGQRLDMVGIPSIVHDEQFATGQSVDFLLRQGRTAIAYLGRIRGSVLGSQRVAGYKDALRAKGKQVRTDLIWDVAFRYSAGRQAVLEALDTGVEFDAIQAGSDELALGALSVLRDRQMNVPEEVAVIGYGDVVWSDYLRPALTTLSSHPEHEAVSVLKILDCLDKNEPPPMLTFIERKLVQRQSG
jgi:DNA-binding LacI/PurR family transcriptional regulator